MLSQEVLSIPESVSPERSYTLSRRIAAIRLTRAANDRLGKLGDILQFQPGTRLDCYGDGYNERTTKVHNGRTIKVHYDGEFYFVFLQDLYDSESDRFQH